jgi:hypothetical protein
MANGLHGKNLAQSETEYAQVWFNGALLESACSESENYLGMRKAIVALGIDSMPNINYLKAAKRVVGMV